MKTMREAPGGVARSRIKNASASAFPIDSRENMHQISPDAFDMLVTLEKRPFERAPCEVIVRLLDETLPDGAKLAAASDPDYPSELAALDEHPAVLVYEGDLTLAERQLRVSIVGSRDAGEAVRADARRVARELAARGAVIVSGLAAGVDAAAHEGALEATTPSGAVGRTIAVMGTPLSQPWPPANARLARRIAQNGLLISLAPQVSGLSFTDEERAESLRARNRAIAAIGLGSLVMAGKEGSSTLREVAHSLELGRPVLIWHSIVEAGEPWALKLLAENPRDETGRALVQAVSSAADVEEALSPWSTVWWL